MLCHGQCLFKVFFCLSEDRICLFVVSEQLVVASQQVKSGNLEVFLAKEQIFVLRVDVYECLPYFLEKGEGHRRVVDKGARLACCRHFSADDAASVVIVKVIAVKERLHAVVCHIQLYLHHTPLGSSLDSAAVRSLSCEQAYSADDDGFSSTCLACDDGESWVEVYVEMFYEGIVFYVQMAYHCFFC